MAISTIAPRGPQLLAPPPPAWPSSAVLLDSDGATLSDVSLLGPPRDRRVALADVEAPDALLDYYFGRSGRRVLLQLIGRLVEGTLATRWAGLDREWWIELDDA